MSEFIHLHRDKVERSHNIFLLFVPAIIFAILVAFFFSRYYGGEVAGISTQLP